MGVNALDEGGGGEAAGEGRMGAEEGEEAEAEGFAREAMGGLDGEVRGGAGGGKAMGVKDPEGEDGALVGGAVEEASEEGAEVVEQLLGLSGLGGLGLGFRLGSGSGWWFGYRGGDG